MRLIEISKDAGITADWTHNITIQFPTCKYKLHIIKDQFSIYGNHWPNWFWRKMVKLILGWEWEKNDKK